jgi:hypothetical protein
MATDSIELPSQFTLPITNLNRLYSGLKDPEYKSNVFFNSNISISELKRIGEKSNIDELYYNWGQTQKKLCEWASSNFSPLKTSPSKPVSKLIKYPCVVSPPPGFEQINPSFPLSDASTEYDISPAADIRNHCTVSSNDIKLHLPPNKYGLFKREKRGTFNEEEISEDKYTGEIKFYQLKKRFGFISLDLDKTDVFICEDDIVLSGISIKKFKDAVLKKKTQRFKFLIKRYYENGNEKRKAVNVEVIE